MIEFVSASAQDFISERISGAYPTIIKKIECLHKAPLPVGRQFEVIGEVIDVDNSSAAFKVILRDSESKTVVGDTTIEIEAIV